MPSINLATSSYGVTLAYSKRITDGVHIMLYGNTPHLRLGVGIRSASTPPRILAGSRIRSGLFSFPSGGRSAFNKLRIDLVDGAI